MGEGGRPHYTAGMPRRLPVDLPAIVEALDEPVGGPTRAFLDLGSGAIELVPRDLDPDANDPGAPSAGAFDDVLNEPTRWREVPPAPLWVRRRIRAGFCDRIDDPHIRLRLREALEKQPAFSPFARVLREFPPVHDEWFRHRHAELEPAALEWLASVGVIAGEVLTTSGPPS